MKLNLKRLMAMLLSIMMVVGMLPTMVFAEDAVETQSESIYVASVNGTQYTDLQTAINECDADETITLISNIDLDEEALTVSGAGKKTIDFNGFTVTSACSGQQMLYVTGDCELVLKDSTAAQNGGLSATKDDGSLSNLIRVETDGTLVIESGTYYQAASNNGSGMIDARSKSTPTITVNGGNFTLGNIGSGANGSPWVFNVSGQNHSHIKVFGGTYNSNVFNLYWRHEVQCNEGMAAIRDNGNGTWTVVPATVRTFEFVDGYDYGIGYETLADALEANKDKAEIEIDLVADATLDITAWQTLAIGGENTTSITINGNNNTLTFNHTNSDWNNVATNNAKLILNDMHITNSGYNNGPWNRHDINFACDVELNNVTSDKALAFKAGAVLDTVTISDANSSDTYAIWIQPNGQTVTITNSTIDMLNCTDGRGIKIDHQYNEAQEQRVTLNVSSTSFITEEKAAIMVKSTVGADINLTNVDISDVVADTVNAVWNDEDTADYLNLINVTGGTVYQEGATPAYVAQIEGGASFTSLADAVEAAESGDTIIILQNGSYEMPKFQNKELTFVGADKENTSINDWVEKNSQGMSGSTVHFENLTINGQTTNYYGLFHTAGVTYDNCNINGLRFLYSPTTFTNCEFNANGVEHSFWTYGASDVTVTNCKFTYTDRAVNCYSDQANQATEITFDGCTFTYAGTKATPDGAVEINSSKMTSMAVAFENDCTAPEKGAMWFIPTWDSLGGVQTTVKVNNEQVWPEKITSVTIGSAEELIAFSNAIGNAVSDGGKYQGIEVHNNPDLVVKLTANIDMEGISGFWPIGDGNTRYFAGTFDGQGHTISNLYCDNNWTYTNAFFRTLGLDTTIKNVTFDNAYFGNAAATSRNNNYAVVVGCIGGAADIVFDNITVTNSTVKANQVGGIIVGRINGSDITVKNCTVGNCTVILNQIYGAALVGQVESDDYADYSEENNTVIDSVLIVDNEYKKLVNHISLVTTDTNAYAETTYVAQIGETKYSTLYDALVAAVNGDTITLIGDVKLAKFITINKSITLDLGEYDITRDDGTALYVNGDVEVTITGNGTVTGYQALYVNSGLVKVNGGSFHGTSKNSEAVYVINTGKVEIYGGTFSGSGTNNFALNEYDATRETSDITVYGGTFVGFNPAENAAEGVGTNFVADGYKAETSDNGTTYTVVPNMIFEAHLVDKNGEAHWLSPMSGNDLNGLLKTAKIWYDSLQGTYDFTIKVLDDCEIKEPVIINFPLTIDFGGNEVKSTAVPAFRIIDGVNVTVKNGNMDTDSYCFILGASDGSTAGNLTIESGKYTGKITVASVTKGTLTINGGEFLVKESDYGATYLLNCIDANYKDGSAKIEVKGGTFANFNPAENAAEGVGTNFVADGYEAKDNGNGIYGVVEKVDYAAWVKAELLAGNSVKLDQDIVIDDYDLVNALKLPSNGNGKYNEVHGNGAVFHVIKPGVVLDLNGHSIIWDAHHDDYCNKRQVSLFFVTITGNPGETSDFTVIDSSEGKTGKVDVYGMGTGMYVVGVDAVGTIAGGTWTNYTCKNCGASNIFLYPTHGGTMNITDGTFEQEDSDYLLGWNGSSKPTTNNGVGIDQDATKMIISGGTFVGFNPENVKFFDTANGSAESTTNGCKLGYMAKDNDDGTFGIKEWDLVIRSTDDMLRFAAMVNGGEKFTGKTIKLGTDIDLAGIEWAPIGGGDIYFAGEFDGQGYTISNLTQTQGARMGLFGLVEKAYIHNFTLANVNFTINENSARVGAVAGNLQYWNVLKDITIDGINVTVNGNDGLIGSVTGYAWKSQLGNVDVKNAVYTVNGTGNVIGGHTAYGRAHVWDTGVTGNNTHWLDGTVQTIDGVEYVLQNYFVGCDVDGIKITLNGTGSEVGGFFGSDTYNSHSNYFVNCHVTDLDVTAAEGTSQTVGGFIAWNNGTTSAGTVKGFDGCSAAGTIKGANGIYGGFVGQVGGRAHEYYNASADVDITSTGIAGGFVGATQAYSAHKYTFTDCIATGAVSGTVAGGFAGKNGMSGDGKSVFVEFNGCSASGKVYATEIAGGLIGEVNTELPATNWNTVDGTGNLTLTGNTASAKEYVTGDATVGYLIGYFDGVANGDAEEGNTVELTLNNNKPDGSDIDTGSGHHINISGDTITEDIITPVANVAQIGTVGYPSLQEAIDNAQDGDVITVLTNINLADCKLQVLDSSYDTYFLVEGKSVTINLNEKTISGAYTGNMLVGVFSTDNGGHLTLTGNGTVNVIATNKVYSLIANYEDGCTIIIENGTYTLDKASDSLIYSGGKTDAAVTVNGGTFTLGNVGEGENGKPWIFNVLGAGDHHVYITGGTFNADINRQHWSSEAVVAETCYVVADTTAGTWTVTDGAVAYVNTGMTSGQFYIPKNIGYATLAEALAAAVQYNDSPVVVIKDCTMDSMVTIPAGKTLTLDLDGKTVTGTDTTSKNFSLIDNRGTLTITDSSDAKTGKMTLTATVNSGWNRYSAVIANNPGGKLIVENGTIEHLGGTNMAYGIDNLTNGKGTYAETIINGGTIKSIYRAIRQFLNGVEAQNILTVNGGTIEGTNKSIWMQDPSKNANSGTITVTKDAVLKGDVYLFVTAGSTEWPVEISIANDAFDGKSTVVTANIPEQYVVENTNGIWGVKENPVYGKVAKIGDTYFDTLADAIVATQPGDTIILLDSITEDVTIDKNLTINGAGKDYTGKMTISGDSSVTVHDVNFVKGEIVQNGTNTTADLIVKNCSFANGNYAITTERIKSVTIEDCEVSGQSLLYAKLTTSNIVVKNVTINKGNYVAHLVYGSTALFENVTATNMTGYGIFTQNYGAKTITLKNCSFDTPKYNSIGVRDDRTNAVDTFIFEGENSMTSMYNGEYAKYVLGAVDATLTAPEGSTVTTTVANSMVKYVAGKYIVVKAVAKIGEDKLFETFVDALNAVQDDATITVLDAEGSERKTKIDFNKAITFTITGNSDYELPTITFTNATVNIVDANIEIGELDARQNATINVKNSTVETVGGSTDGIVKAYYNGKINIEDSEVYAHQFTVMGVVNLTDSSELTVTWQTNVYGNGLVNVGQNATLNTAAMHLTGKDYNNRDNTDADRVNMPAQITVNGGKLNVGTECISINGANYNYNSSKGINIGTIAGKKAVLDIVNGANVNIYMADGETANIGADGTVNVDGTLTVGCRKDGGTATLVNNGSVILSTVYSVVTANKCGNVTTTVDGYEVEYADGKYTVKEVTLWSIGSSNIVLGNELAMWFYVANNNLEGTDYVAVVTKSYADGRDDLVVEIPYSEWETTTNNRMRFKFDGIAAKEMSDNISVVVKTTSTGNAVSTIYNDSIRGYVERGFETGNAQKEAELATMLVDMLNYGAAAQGMFNYGKSDLANKNMTEYQNYATQSVDCENNQVKGTGYKSVSLTLESSIQFNMKFYKSSVSKDMTAVVSFTDHYGTEHNIKISGDKFVSDGETWSIVVEELVPADFSQIVTCTFIDANDNEVEGVSGVDSMESFCARAIAGDGGSWYEDIAKFMTSAYNYFH